MWSVLQAIAVRRIDVKYTTPSFCFRFETFWRCLVMISVINCVFALLFVTLQNNTIWEEHFGKTKQ